MRYMSVNRERSTTQAGSTRPSARSGRNIAKLGCFGVAFRASEKKWLPDDGGDEYLWSEDLENHRNIGVLQRRLIWRAPSTRNRNPDYHCGSVPIDLAERSGTVRTKDLEAIGVPRQYPSMMCREGLLIRVSCGVYKAAAEDSREEESGTSPMTEDNKPSDFYSD